MSPALAFIGVSILGTWGLASLGLIVGGIILLVSPGDAPAASDNVVGGIVLIAAGLVSGGLMQIVVTPLLGLDPPFPISARKLLPASKLTRWVPAGALRDYTDGVPREVRLKSRRIVLVRQGETVSALNGLCSHARLPLGGFPGPVAALPVKDDCVTCPFHGATFELATGKVVRQPFTSEWNNDHPFLGRFQSGIFSLLSRLPAPSGLGVSMKAEDTQVYPVRIENGDVFVAIPPRK